MGLFDIFFKKKEDEDKTEEITEVVNQVIEYNFEEGKIQEIVDNNFIDTNNPYNQAKLKHNLELLIKKAKEKNKIDEFRIIRCDNHFPTDYVWRVASEDTALEMFTCRLTMEMKKMMEENNMNLTDKEQYLVYTPEFFRTTKHFTVNTPLDATGSYNQVSKDRTFNIIDKPDNLFQSGYGYSFDYNDCYLDVTHEGLKISPEAIILIEKSKLDEIKDEKILEQLKNRRVITYTGEASLAIDMILAEQGILPTEIGSKYATYDNETRNIIKNSMKNKAEENNLLYAQSHGGSNGHFSSNLDDEINEKRKNMFKEYVEYLKNKFPDYKSYLTEDGNFNYDYALSSKNSIYDIRDLINQIGLNNLVQATKEYNIIRKNKLENDFEEYVEDRKNVDKEVSNIFKYTLEQIKKYYYNKKYNNYSTEENYKLKQLFIQFFGNNKVKKQIEAAQTIIQELELLKYKDYEKTEENVIEKSGFSK